MAQMFVHIVKEHGALGLYKGVGDDLAAVEESM